MIESIQYNGINDKEIPLIRNKVVLKVENLGKVYNKGKKNQVKALESINFSIDEGEFISIMGPSGSGKSTLLNLIGALDTPTTGEIYISNQPVSKLSGMKLNRFRRKRLGLIFQAYNLIPVLTAIENVALSLTLDGVKKKDRRARAKELLELVGLGERINHKMNELSGGELQRIAIARALANKPSLILADEPTGNLDSKRSEAIMNLFKKLNEEENQTFIIVTHNPLIAEKCDKTIHIKDGKLEKITINSQML